MSSPCKRIGVLTGGGDAPGLNAVIRAVVKTATIRYRWQVVGIEHGFEGLLGSTAARPLGGDDVRGLLPRGGTILGAASRGHFVRPTENGRFEQNEAAFAEGLRNIRLLGLDALVVIGGEGTQAIAYEFSRRGVPIVGVPKTIDNDLRGTDLTFGFDTAVGIATEAIDRLHTTAESHDRVLLLEVMGRHAGWIALEAGLAGGADVILIPEIPFHVEKVAAKVREREGDGRRFSIVVVAEGAAAVGGAPVYRESAAGARRLGGIAEQVGGQVMNLTGKESRVVVLGHVQRGGTPTAFDRMLATCYGSKAVGTLAENNAGVMVAWDRGEMTTVPLQACATGIKSVPPDHYLIRTARDLSISFAGEDD